MKIVDHKDFTNEALKAARSFMGLNDWTMYFQWTKESPEVEKGAACMRYADYERFYFKIEFFEWFVKDNEFDPDEIARVALHEILHVFTIAPLKVFEEDKTLKEFLGTASFSAVSREMSIFNEQMNVRLEQNLLPHFRKSEQYSELMKLCSCEEPT